MRTLMRKTARLVGMGLVATSLGFAAGPVQETALKPQIVVPKLSRAPVVDGRMAPGEWDAAAALSGFGLHGQGRLAHRQSHFWIGYDDTTLYMAVKSPVWPAGRRLVSLHKKRDGGFFGDDVIEILIDPFGGKHPGGIPYFYFIGNSAGVIGHDSREMPGIGQSEMTWNGAWQFQNQVDDQWWTAELSIPLANLDVNDIAQHPEWAVQMSRTYARPVVWTNWPDIGQINNPSGAALATVAAGVPFLRLLSVDGLVKGMNGSVSGEVVNPGNAATDLSLTVRFLDGAKEIAKKEYPCALAGGGRLPFSFAEPVDLPEKAICEIVLTEKAAGKVLVFQRFPFLRDTPLPVLQEAGKEPDFAQRIRHLPSRQQIAVWADVFGHPKQKEIRSAALTVKTEAGVEKQRTTLKLSPGGTIKEAVSATALPEGAYTATVGLLDQAGKVIDSVEHKFVVRNYPWFGAGIGVTDQVLPPWTPLQAKGTRVACWGREYVFDGTGLPEQVKVKGEDLLAGPVTLSGTANGKPFRVAAQSAVQFTSTTPVAVAMTGTGAGGGLKVRTTSTMEYDGMVKVELDIVPDGTVNVEKLQLTVPLLPGRATLIHAVGDHMRTGQFSGLIPAGQGVVWNSKDNLFHSSILGTFAPYIWLGNEERGFAWAASSDEGWVTDDEKALHEVVRTGQGAQLVNHLIARPVELSRPRKIVFALQATPFKPLPKGWRGWEFTPADSTPRPGTRRLALNPFRSYFYTDPTAYIFGTYVDDYPKAKAFYGKYVDLEKLDGVFWCTTANITNAGTPESDVFRDEWFQANSVQFDSASFGRRSFGPDRKRYLYGTANLVPSMIDMRLWAIRELLKNGVVNGMYEDNAYLWPVLDEELGTGYQREDGEWQSDFMLFSHREYRKRMAGVFHELGLEPLIYTHLSTALIAPIHSFSTIAYDGEWREITDDGLDFMDKWPLDYFRAVTLGQHNGLVPLWLPMAHLVKKDLAKHTRTMLAVLQLHDILCDNGHADSNEIRRQWAARAAFGISDPEVEFCGYWDKNNRIKIDSPDVKTSYWQKKDRALAVLANFAKQDTTVACRAGAGLPAGVVQRVADAQSGEAIPFRQEGKETVFEVTVPRRDYRLVVIECAAGTP